MGRTPRWESAPPFPIEIEPFAAHLGDNRINDGTSIDEHLIFELNNLDRQYDDFIANTSRTPAAKTEAAAPRCNQHHVNHNDSSNHFHDDSSNHFNRDNDDDFNAFLDDVINHRPTYDLIIATLRIIATDSS